MRFVTVRDLRLKPAELWRRLKTEGEIIVTSNGKPVAILAGVSEETLEKTLAIFRRTRAAIALDEMQRSALKSGASKLSAAEIDEEVKKARQDRER